MSQLYEKPLLKGNTDSYTFTVSDKWLNGEGILSATVETSAGLSSSSIEASGGVLSAAFTGLELGRHTVKWSWSTSSKEGSYTTYLDVLTEEQVNNKYVGEDLPKLEQLLKVLSSSHMRSLAVAKEGLGFSDSLLPTLSATINLATEEIFERLNLGFNTVKVLVNPNQSKYVLNRNNLAYIDDSIERPLLDNIVQIAGIEVIDKQGERYGVDINDTNDYYAVSSNTPSTLLLNDKVLKECKEVLVQIVMSPTPLPLTTDTENRELPLSVGQPYLEVLALCTAKLYYATSASKENVQKAGMIAQMYEQKIEQLISAGASGDMNYFVPTGSNGEWP